MADARTPLALLATYQERALRSRAADPVVREVLPEWQGVAFIVGDQQFIAGMDEVVEILDPPPCTRVPGTQSWFLGIGNVRGNLLPVSDLRSYALRQAGATGGMRRNSRVLTCGHGEAYAGLQVDEVQGLRRFYLEERHAASALAPDALAPYVAYEFRRHGQVWPVLQLSPLTASEEFLRIGQ